MIQNIRDWYDSLSVRDDGPFEVQVLEGQRGDRRGQRTIHRLLIPQSAPGLTAPPWPGVVLAHGFTRNYRQHINNAYYLASRGIVVLLPNLTTMLGGPKTWMQCVLNLAEALDWLAEQADTPSDTLHGLLDPKRMGLAGHSLGAAVAFEAAIEAARLGYPLKAVCLLDCTPLRRTGWRAPEFPPLEFIHLRSEPCKCNLYGAVATVLKHMPFAPEDVLIPGSRHTDGENPTDIRGVLLCGNGGKEKRAEYTRRMGEFFGRVL